MIRWAEVGNSSFRMPGVLAIDCRGLITVEKGISSTPADAEAQSPNRVTVYVPRSASTKDPMSLCIAPPPSPKTLPTDAALMRIRFPFDIAFPSSGVLQPDTNDQTRANRRRG